MGKDMGAGVSRRRIATWVIVIGGHLGLLMLMLGPATPRHDLIGTSPRQATPLRLRFIDIRMLRPATSAPVASPIASPPKRPARIVPRPITRRPSIRSTEPPVSHGNEPVPVAPTLPSYADGGFARQLRDAQQGHAPHGLPGSDLRHAPGIQLTDPRDQGIGAVARKTQRLFGVPDSHCVDVDRLRSLSVEELSARHLSPRDVTHMNEKYDCDRPMGLSF